MKTQYTPGPWTVLQVCDDVYIETANLDTREGPTICQLKRKSDYANARLIAAAPDLLDALELIAGFQANEPYHETDWKAQVYKAKDIARAAIQRARGE